ncbi:helix-turn-helix domain-containing protein [Microbacterium sp. 22195]|uniref:helix-turn-helix domain-containing protein n=1 Tax=Microbacterium sp. 22195 TaxID=3453891 RepID=UPI003F8569CA
MSAEKKTDGRGPSVLTVAEAAEEVRLSVDSVQKAIKNNDLAVKYYGTKPLVKFTELMRWFDSLPDEKPERAA